MAAAKKILSEPDVVAALERASTKGEAAGVKAALAAIKEAMGESPSKEIKTFVKSVKAALAA